MQARSLAILHCKEEAKAARRILLRSSLHQPGQLLRLSGVRLLHTSGGRRQGGEGGDKKQGQDDDERDRMLSALKTAVGFLAVPMLLLLVFGMGGSRREEGEVVRGWLAREEQAGLVPGQVWYLLPMAWWTGWHAFVNWSEAPCSSGSLGRRRRAGQALSSSLASDSSPRDRKSVV